VTPIPLLVLLAEASNIKWDVEDEDSNPNEYSQEKLGLPDDVQFVIPETMALDVLNHVLENGVKTDLPQTLFDELNEFVTDSLSNDEGFTVLSLDLRIDTIIKNP